MFLTNLELFIGEKRKTCTRRKPHCVRQLDAPQRDQNTFGGIWAQEKNVGHLKERILLPPGVLR